MPNSCNKKVAWLSWKHYSLYMMMQSTSLPKKWVCNLLGVYIYDCITISASVEIIMNLYMYKKGEGRAGSRGGVQGCAPLL